MIACDIETNIKTEFVISKKIDINVIEELKRRRLEQTDRRRGEALDIKRDQIIQSVVQQQTQ